ncbi:MAG: Lrp/AsnC family transcriptional regulator [Gammaproteobacteria bacterium]|jgi:Lrp/AsnC family transcriptional regulator|nr:Lrp/AsnC family transcriptional regulator [Gammaproteobacteria bacterium]
MAEGLSKVDLRILEQLQLDSSISSGELAEKVGLSQSPCWRRLQRLKEEGYIRGQVALLDPAKFGPSMYIFAYLEMATLSDSAREEFLRKVELTPEILECHAIFGEMDIMIKVIAPSMDWYQNFVFKTLLKFPGVKSLRSTVTLSQLKYTTAIPLRNYEPRSAE